MFENMFIRNLNVIMEKILFIACFLAHLFLQAQQDFRGKIVYSNTIKNFDKFLGVEELEKEDPKGAQQFLAGMKEGLKKQGFKFGTEDLSTVKRKLVTEFKGDSVRLITSTNGYMDYDPKNFKKQVVHDGREGIILPYRIKEENRKVQINVDKDNRVSILGYDCYKLTIKVKENSLGNEIEDITELYITNSVKIPLHYNVIVEIPFKTDYHGLVLAARYTTKEFGYAPSLIEATEILLE